MGYNIKGCGFDKKYGELRYRLIGTTVGYVEFDLNLRKLTLRVAQRKTNQHQMPYFGYGTEIFGYCISTMYLVIKTTQNVYLSISFFFLEDFIPIYIELITSWTIES